MIRNIIFDMVGVLMRFDTESYIEEHHLSEADVAILRKEVFRSLEWAMQDRGSISTVEAERRICDRVPAHLRFAVHDLLYREGRKIVPIDGMRELLQDLKGREFHLFVLSNTCVHWRSFWEKIPGHELFEDVLISADNPLSLMIHRPTRRRHIMSACGPWYFTAIPRNCGGSWRRSYLKREWGDPVQARRRAG